MSKGHEYLISIPSNKEYMMWQRTTRAPGEILKLSDHMPQDFGEPLPPHQRSLDQLFDPFLELQLELPPELRAEPPPPMPPPPPAPPGPLSPPPAARPAAAGPRAPEERPPRASVPVQALLLNGATRG